MQFYLVIGSGKLSPTQGEEVLLKVTSCAPVQLYDFEFAKNRGDVRVCHLRTGGRKWGISNKCPIDFGARWHFRLVSTRTYTGMKSIFLTFLAISKCSGNVLTLEILPALFK